MKIRIIVYSLLFILASGLFLSSHQGSVFMMNLTHFEASIFNPQKNSGVEKLDFKPMPDTTLPIPVVQDIKEGLPLSARPKLLWQFHGHNYLTSREMSVVDDKLYFASNRNILYALNKTTGIPKWQYKIEDHMSYSKPLVIGNLIYFNSTHDINSIGKITALSTKYGTFQWSIKSEKYHNAHLFLMNHNIGVIGGPYNFSSVDTKTRQLQWSIFVLGISTYDVSAPTISNNQVYLITDNSNILSIDVTTGEIISKYSLVKLFNSPLLGDYLLNNSDETVIRSANNKLYFVADIKMGNHDNDKTMLYALDEKTKAVIWQHRFNKSMLSIPVVIDEHVYVSNHYHTLYAFDATTGQMSWKNELLEFNGGKMIVFNKTIYLASCHGVYALDQTTGAELWYVKVGSCVTDIKLDPQNKNIFYVINEFAHVYAFKIGG